MGWLVQWGAALEFLSDFGESVLKMIFINRPCILKIPQEQSGAM